MAKQRIKQVVAIADGDNVVLSGISQDARRRQKEMVSFIDSLFAGFHKEDNRLKIERLERIISVM